MTTQFSPEAERLEWAIAEGRQRLLDGHMRATSAGAAFLAEQNQGAPEAPLSEAHERLIEAKMDELCPPEGAPTPYQAERARRPGYAKDIDKTIAGSKSQYTRVGPNIKGDRGNTITLDPPGIVFVDQQRGRPAQDLVEFDCKSGLVTNSNYPAGMLAKDKPVVLQLSRRTWRQDNADGLLKRVRWSRSKGVRILAPGDPELQQ
jgi:hypothetical protein